MRFLTAHSPSRGAMPSLLLFFYGYFALHWLTSILMFQHKLGFSYASVVRYYLGDPNLFMPARSFIGLLEVSHFHLFAMGMFFIVFSHLIWQTPYRVGFKTAVNRLLALSLLLDVISGWLICYVAAPFAWLKIGSFITLQLVSAILLIGLVMSLFLRPVNRSEHPT